MNIKKIIFALLLMLSGMVAYAEYAMVGDVVYWLNNELTTAWVQNIRSTSSSITIPSYINYRGVKYEVVGFEKNDFNTNARNTYNISSAILGDGLITNIATLSAIEREEMERPFRYDYDYYRAGITTLNLPNTLLTIGKGAFDGLRSLKSIIIPASVTNLPDGVFADYLPNLQSVVILGVPNFINDKEIQITSTDKDGNLNYYKLVKEAFDLEFCRNIKTFSMPEYEKKLPIVTQFYKANANLEKLTNEYNASLKQSSIFVPVLKDEACTDAKTIQEAYNQAYKYLNDMFMSYKNNEQLYDSLMNLLKQHPYYDGTMLIYEILELDPKDPQFSSIETYSMKYRARLLSEYNELIGGKMERNLKLNFPEKYTAGYLRLHPEKRGEIDRLLRDYRCENEYSKYKYVVNYIEGKPLAKTCRQRQWESYSHLFESKENFDKVYNDVITDYGFRLEISKREVAYSTLDQMKVYEQNHIKEIEVRNINKKPNEETYNIIIALNKLEKSYYYDRAVSYLIRTLPKVQKEYQKNGQYFGSQIEFFKAYSSDSYNQILKENKKK